MEDYPDTLLRIGAQWRRGIGGRTAPVCNPATGRVIGTVAMAAAGDLEDAINFAEAGFAQWRDVPATERASTIRRGAELLRQREEQIARLITLEQGKPLSEARAEIRFSAHVAEWFAEEATRLYGRLIPPRSPRTTALASLAPLGVVAGLAPWNYPVGQAVRKIAIALAAGCSIIIKVAEETPAAAAAMTQAFVDGGVPPEALQLVFGDPEEIANRLIDDPQVACISFTGSTHVGRQLASRAGSRLKRCVMELGGHAPALVFADSDLDSAASALAADKMHNAGQACISPTRFIVERQVHNRFLDRFCELLRASRVGDGADPETTMGPLANRRRVTALDALVQDAVAQGGTIACGGHAIAGDGFFFEPTVLVNVPPTARIMNEEPFGPIAVVNSFAELDEAVSEANRLPYALAAYAWSTSARTIAALTRGVRSGMLSINHNGLGYPEVPFGGILDSGYGNEGGLEAMREMMFTRFVTVLEG